MNTFYLKTHRPLKDHLKFTASFRYNKTASSIVLRLLLATDVAF